MADIGVLLDSSKQVHALSLLHDALRLIRRSNVDDGSSNPGMLTAILICLSCG